MGRKINYKNYVFDSKLEYERFRELEILVMANEITELRKLEKPDDTYLLIVNGNKICKYTPDFKYKTKAGIVIEEVKSKKLKKLRPDYSIRKKLFCALHPEYIFVETIR